MFVSVVLIMSHFFCSVFLVFYSLAQIRTSLCFTITSSSIIQSAVINSVMVLDFGFLYNILIC